MLQVMLSPLPITIGVMLYDHSMLALMLLPMSSLTVEFSQGNGYLYSAAFSFGSSIVMFSFPRITAHRVDVAESGWNDAVAL